MKNIQIIDGAINTSYSVFEIPDKVFKSLFPDDHQDVEFIEDAINRLGKSKLGKLMKHTWNSRLSKTKIVGIHGTLFIGMQYRKLLYPNKRENDLDNPMKFSGADLIKTKRASGIIKAKRPK